MMILMDLRKIWYISNGPSTTWFYTVGIPEAGVSDCLDRSIPGVATVSLSLSACEEVDRIGRCLSVRLKDAMEEMSKEIGNARMKLLLAE
jgi:hypothetical protein